MSQASNYRELSELLGALCEGTIPSEQFSQLEQLLNADLQARDWYVDYLMLCGELKQRIPYHAEQPDLPPAHETNPSGGHEQAIKELASHLSEEEPWEASARREKIRQLAEESFKRNKAEEKRRQEELLLKLYRVRRRRLIVGFSSLAALLTILLAARFAPSPRMQEASDQPAVQPVVALVTKLNEAKWEQATDIGWGTELTSGPLCLLQGHAEITFKSQAKIILEAPAKIHLVNENAARLDSGVLTANVPKQAHGFTVNTPSVYVKDLGTEFGLAVNEEGVADVQVLTGEVAASFDSDGDDTPRTSRILRQNEAMRFAAKTGTAQPIAWERDRFPRSWDDVLYLPRLSPGIVFERTIPPSLGGSDFEGDSTIHLFLEKVGVVLSEELAVNITTPGTSGQFQWSNTTLPAGTVVDSYLIHCNTRKEPGKPQQLSSTITFPRPIVGLIVDTHKLDASDAIVGHVQTHYPGKEAGRGLEAGPDNAKGFFDRITLTPDRRQMQVLFYASTYDQMRVLIASPDQGNGP